MRPFFWFILSGVAGFLVDAGVLYCLAPSLGLYLSRVISFLCAVFTTWLINRALTFRSLHSGQSTRKEFMIYLFLMLGGGAVNYATYVILIAIVPVVAQHPFLGVGGGSIAGMFINFCASRLFLFKYKRSFDSL
nr:GtrA family protein [Paraburkholderia solisilvae]